MLLGKITIKSGMLLFLYIVQTTFIVISAVEFDQNYFGVTFQPFVKYAENGMPYEFPRFESYTRKNIETMMALVSKKFSKVMVEGDLSTSEIYNPNFTYEHDSYATVYSGEVAAQINRKNDNKKITLLYTVVLRSYKRNEACVSLVLEASKISNNIFPGTVEGIVLQIPGNLMEFQQVLYLLDFHRENASKLGLKLGAELNCYHLISPKNYTVADIQRQIINKSDFVMCRSHNAQSLGPKTAFESVSIDHTRFKHHIHKINPSVDVLAISLLWYGYGIPDPQNSENLRVFWQTANDWAVTNKYRIYLRDAFDNPFKDSNFRLQPGWWRLRRNSEIDSIDGYVEKASEIKQNEANFPSHKNENVNSANFGSSILTVAIITFTIIVTLIGVPATVILLYLKWLQRKDTAIISSEVKEFFEGNSSQQRRGSATAIDTAISAPYDFSLDISKESLKIDKNKILGSGEFGIVFKALIEWESGCTDQVALKVTKDNCQSRTVKGFLSEIKIMSYLGRHPNIVALKGAYTADLTKGVVYIATELCDLGSLLQFLRKKGRMEGDNAVDITMSRVNAERNELMELTTLASIPMLDMVRWSHQIACGMKYLEEKHVVHADLATRNVLLTSEKVAKISDFGLSRRMYNYTNYVKTHQEPLPWRWMAIEALKKLDFSSKSDVWSYGITLWEIFSEGDVPYPGVSWTQSFVTNLVNGLRPDCPQFATPEIYNIMRDCWNFEADERPNFSELVDVTRIALDKCRVMVSHNILHIDSN